MDSKNFFKDIILSFLFGQAILPGIIGNAAYDALQSWWKQKNRLGLEDTFFSCVLTSFRQLKPIISKYSEDGTVDIDINKLKGILLSPRIYDLVNEPSQFINQCLEEVTIANVLIIPGHNLTDQEYKGFTYKIIYSGWIGFIKKIPIKDEVFKEFVTRSLLQTNINPEQQQKALSIFFENCEKAIINFQTILLDNLDEISTSIENSSEDISYIKMCIEELNNNRSINTYFKEFILIPPGPFYFGNNESVDESPMRKIFTKNYYCQRFLVTNKDYSEFVSSTGYQAPSHWLNGFLPEELALHPVVNVSWYDANYYCNWKQTRLPTEVEWEKAARGVDQRLWPWGMRFSKNRCNTKESILGKTSIVGLFSPDGDSPFGISDMAGNVWEWIADWYTPGGKVEINNGNVEPEKFKVVKGGSWADIGIMSRITSRYFVDPQYKSSSIGFRCIVDY